MTSAPLTVLQVNAQDAGGGAEHVARSLFEAYRRRGVRSHFAVGRRTGDDPSILSISTGERHGRMYRAWRHVADKFGGPRRVFDEMLGVESFHYPATYRLPSLPSERPDIIHLHNLHGGYFDLRALPWLSRQAPLVLTLHDAWLLSGHCSHSFDCERWKIGCGACPDLSIYPAVRRDATAYNWRRKRSIFEQSRVYVATPCRWLMNRVEQSMLRPGIVESRIIPNGVDVSTFKPDDKLEARRKLGIRPDLHVLLFTASGLRANMFKDFPTIEAAARSISPRPGGRDVLLIGLGEGDRSPAEDTPLGDAIVRYVPFESDPVVVARYYQAADLYLHAARAETFPLTILEAMACGTPVIATAVGGITEQVRSLGTTDLDPAEVPHDPSHATGILVARGDHAAMARAIETLLKNDELRRQLGANATRSAHLRFDLEKQCDAYLDWYADILEISRD